MRSFAFQGVGSQRLPAKMCHRPPPGEKKGLKDQVEVQRNIGALVRDPGGGQPASPGKNVPPPTPWGKKGLKDQV